jgi:predicted nucleotidyltransferase
MLIESNTQRFLELIFKYPSMGFTIREIAKKLGVSPPTASSISKKLEKSGMIIVKKERVSYKVFGNLENENFVDIKRIYNLYSLIPLKNFLVREFEPNFIIVYGSYSVGEDTENSDVDIFVESFKRKQIDLSRFEKKLARKIHLVVDIFKSLPQELKMNILNGVILYGVVEF